ncbi:MAG: protein-L-isoaspartate(D-aspartate) O-methyltransferase [Burkholderiales bacterium]|nr:MAG: protein-L-isoaspartate(D-aspartate) O-methyltransferase [Burkholderiales bacterium]
MKRDTPPAQRARPGFPARLPGVAAPAAPGPASRPAAAAQAPSGAGAGRAPVTPHGTGLDSSAFRAAMVRRLQAQGLVHPGVLAAMQAVERHRFVDSALVSQAYEDTSLPIGLGQTISKPSVVARMAELLCEGREGLLGRVLEIGTGCGYQAAVLSHLSREVYSIERLRGLHEKARENLRWFRLSNVHLLFGDGMLGFGRGAPYAGIIAAAGGDALPQAWLDQLAVGGRLVAPARSATGQQHLTVVDRTAQGWVSRTLDVVNFVPLKSGTV